MSITCYYFCCRRKRGRGGVRRVLPRCRSFSSCLSYNWLSECSESALYLQVLQAFYSLRKKKIVFLYCDPKNNDCEFVMKKIVSILAASMMLLGIDAIAQPAITAGYLRSFERGKSGSESVTQPTDGFFAGVDFTLPLGDYLNFVPGLYYAMTSKQNVADLYFVKADFGRRTDHMINAPLMLNYCIELNSDFRFFFCGGPTLSFGLASVYKVEKESIDLYSKDGYLNRFDVMLGAGAGIEMMEKFRLSFGYDWGMLNRTSYDNLTVKRRQFHVGISFLF